jgi:hypothetical protein
MISAMKTFAFLPDIVEGYRGPYCGEITPFAGLDPICESHSTLYMVVVVRGIFTSFDRQNFSSEFKKPYS